MKAKLAVLALIALTVVVSAVEEVHASISQAACLFLRIAPGARAAGMGEAFVALADDATATHWNPAGLGAYPLASSWVTSKIPAEYLPVKSIAVLKTRSGSNYLAYDVWAVTAQGLARYDNKSWNLGEVFNTRTDQTVAGIISKYFSVTDDQKLARMTEKVAAVNNRGSSESLAMLRDSLMAAVAADYNHRDALQGDLDSLVACYAQCRVNWDKIREVKSLFAEGMKDGSLNVKETDKISFAVEQARTRFIPETITLPYQTALDGEVTCMTPLNDMLLVGTTRGLVRYTGRVWQTMTVESGLPSNTVTCLASVTAATFVGTDSGLARFNGLTVEKVDPTTGAPAGAVSALTAKGPNNVYAVVNNEIIHYDGKQWSAGYRYPVALDDTPESVARKFALYGTPRELETYVTKVKQLNPDLAPKGYVLRPGDTIVIPYAAQLIAPVKALALTGTNTLWLGTDHGILYNQEGRWKMPGYKIDTLKQDQTVNDLVAGRDKLDSSAAQKYSEGLRVINDLSNDTLHAGEVVAVYENPAASPVRTIAVQDDRLLFGTDNGLIEYDGKEWGRSDLYDLGTQPTSTLVIQGDESWFVGRDRIITRANGRPEISLMYVKWLPALASDLYYAYASFVKSTDSWGTFGGNVTFISYGKFSRTAEGSPVVVGTFESFETAVTGSYGTSVSRNLSLGISAKFIYSKLADAGAGIERGKGTATDFAVDLGLLYRMFPRLNVGVALTNLGPRVSYIDAAQSDPLPRNFALGIAYKVFQSEFNRLVIAVDANKILVGLQDTIKLNRSLNDVVVNSGLEYTYSNLISVRGGYIYDNEGKIKVFTLGAGLNLLDRFRFDFAYIPSQGNSALSNVLRSSITIWP